MAIEGVTDPCARAFWFLSALVSVVGLSTYVEDLRDAGASFEEQVIFYGVKGVVIGLTIFFTLQMIGYMFLWDPPTRTYRTGRAVRVIFQRCVLVAMHYFNFKYPTMKVLVLSNLVLAGGVGAAQLAYPAKDFHIGHALLTIICGFFQASFGLIFDPERDFMLVWIPRCLPCVILVFLSNSKRGYS